MDDHTRFLFLIKNISFICNISYICNQYHAIFLLIMLEVQYFKYEYLTNMEFVDNLNIIFNNIYLITFLSEM